MAMNKRKTTTAIVAGVTAAALLLGGTFAWTSIQQEAKNEAIVDINPGGRLHDDFDGKNKDVYVENFFSGATGVNIFARIRLDQYFEVGQEAGKNKESEEERNVKVEVGGAVYDEGTWVTYKPVDAEGTPLETLSNPVQANGNWQWTLGNDDTNLPYYMPTFNMNKDSLLADINGTYEGTTEGDIVHYDDYVKYGPDGVAALEGTEVYDWDEDTTEESEELNNFNNGGITYEDTTPIDSADVYHKSTDEDGNVLTHTAKPIDHAATVYTMAEWLALPDDQKIGPYWVYDTDGWAYWAQPIEPGTTTGLLLDSINMSKVPDDNYYYGINVVGQFATASDWTMLYDKTGTEEDAMTDGAKQLMELITGIPATEDGGEDDNTLQVLELTAEGTNIVEINPGDSVQVVSYDDNADMTSVKVGYYEGVNEEEGTPYYYELTEDQYEYDPATGELYLIDESYSDTYKVTDNSGNVSGYLSIYYESDGTILNIGYVPSDATNRGYIMPGEELMLAASTSDSGTINNEDCTWSAYCGEGHECNISEDGILKVVQLEGGVDEPHLITVTCNYVNEEQGLDLTAEFHIVVSDEDLNIAVKVKDAEGNVVDGNAVETGKQYTLYTEVSTFSNGVVRGFDDYHWDYNVTGANGGAAVSEDQFMAFKEGTYSLSAWCSECITGSHEPSTITATGESMSPYVAMVETGYDDNTDTIIYGNVAVGADNQEIDLLPRLTNGYVPAIDSITSSTDDITVSYDKETNTCLITVADDVIPGSYTLNYEIIENLDEGILGETGTIDLVIDAAE